MRTGGGVERRWKTRRGGWGGGRVNRGLFRWITESVGSYPGGRHGGGSFVLCIKKGAVLRS